MERKPPERNDQSAVNNRWWAEVGKEKKPPPARPAPVGSRFYRAAEGFEQEKARERLTDHNLKILKQAQPTLGEWTYIALVERAMSQQQREKIKRALSLPRFAAAVFVDCGRSARVIATGTPPGERVLELTLGGAPSLDCWVRDDWVREDVFRSTDEAIRAFRRAVDQYLSPAAIERANAIVAKV